MMRNYGCRIRENIVINGFDAIILENQKLRVTILTGKGCDIIELLYKPKDVEFMWHSPNELINYSDFGQYTGDSLNNYLDLYSGGWQEIIPNGGPECNYKGTVLGMHGEVVNIPWSYEITCDREDKIEVKFSVKTRRTPLEIIKTICLEKDNSNIYFREKVINHGHEMLDYMWGQHPTVGAPFLSGLCRIETSAAKVLVDGPEKDFDRQRLIPSSENIWPMAKTVDGKLIDLSIIPPQGNDSADLFYLTDFEDEAFYKIINPRLKLAFGMHWDKKMFPYCWVWLVCNGAYGYPWYGRTYNLAMEPWSSYPSKGLIRAIENGTSKKISAKSVICTEYICKIENLD